MRIWIPLALLAATQAQAAETLGPKGTWHCTMIESSRCSEGVCEPTALARNVVFNEGYGQCDGVVCYELPGTFFRGRNFLLFRSVPYGVVAEVRADMSLMQMDRDSDRNSDVTTISFGRCKEGPVVLMTTPN